LSGRTHSPGDLRQLVHPIMRVLASPDHHARLAEMKSPEVSAQPPKSADGRVEQPVSLRDVGAIAAERAEQELVRRVLEETRGNRKLAARKMNICYKALLNKLKRWSGPETRTTSEQTSQREASEAA